MFFERDEITLILREEDLAETIRKPIARQQAKKVLEHIEVWEDTTSDQWKARSNTNEAKLNDGDPFALAEVFKSLCLRRESDTLSAADRSHLSQAERFLTEELAVALGKSQKAVHKQIDRAALRQLDA